MTSTTLRPVVVGIDGTPGCRGALRHAAAEARRHGGPLHLVHVEPSYLPMTPMLPFYPGDVESVARSLLDAALREVHAVDRGLTVTTSMGVGATAHELARAADGAVLLAVGHDTRSGLDLMWHGATAVRVAARATVPVAVVPADWDPDAPLHGRVVVGLQSVPHATEVLAHGFEAARAAGATLVVVHAWDLKDPYLDRIEARTHAEDWEADGRRLVEGALEPWRAAYPDVPVEVQVRHGVPATVLTDVAAGADLLVLARRATVTHPAGHLGTTARAVLHLCRTRVLVHPAGTITDGPSPLRVEDRGALVR